MMRLKTFVRCSASVAVLALTALPAWAQDNLPQQQPTTTEQTDADSQTAQTDPGGENVVVVTGIRESLRSQQNIRRNSDQIVDSIVAEDIGKLPDIAVSDTAARIPGIQVERNGGEASRVLLRGFDRFNYTTTYNGREIFTAETRSVALQDFPAGGISAIEAFKTSSAELVEPGIAGLINVRSRRPFDFSGLEIAGSVWGNYPNQSQEFSPNAQLLLSNRWNVGDGEIGALINFSYNRLHFQDSIRRHGFFIADLAGGRSPDWPEIRYDDGDRWRPSINGAIQWRPSPNLEFYVEGLWQGYREREMDRMFAQPLWGGSSYENIVFDGSSNRIISGTVNDPGGPFEAWGFQGAGKRHTDTFQFAAGGSWDAGPLRVSADIARTSSEFNLRTESIDYEINTESYSVDWFTGVPGGSGPTFQVRGIDLTNPAFYNYRGFFEDYLTAKGDDWQARLDFQYEGVADFLPQIEWGLRYVDRNASATGGAFYWNYTGRNCCGTTRPPGAPGVPISSVPLDYQLFDPGFRSDDNAPIPTTWFAPTFRSVWDNLGAFRQFNIDLTGQGSLDGPGIDPARTFNINERSYAAYGQLNYEFLLGSTTVDGAVGMRVVQTDEDIQGTAFTTAGPQPIDFQTSYTDWLPNASMRIRFSPQWQVRLAYAKTRTRPTFGQLNPALRLDAPPGCTPGGPTDCVRRGSGGNPFLQPLESDNFDASLEYYFSRTGFATLSVFQRNMQGFITNRAFEFPVPDAETGLPLLITGPVNTREARIQGFEAQVSSFFDFLPGVLSGLGAQANVTYIDAKADFIIFGDDNPNQAMLNLQIPDVSKWTFNLVGMYERNGLTLRLAYNHRSDFPEGDLAERDGFFTLQGRANAIGRLDWSSSYVINENLTVFFDWTNILGDPFQSDIVRINYPGGVPSTPEVFPMVVRYEESVLTSGIRFRF